MKKETHREEDADNKNYRQRSQPPPRRKMITSRLINNNKNGQSQTYGQNRTRDISLAIGTTTTIKSGEKSCALNSTTRKTKQKNCFLPQLPRYQENKKEKKNLRREKVKVTTDSEHKQKHLEYRHHHHHHHHHHHCHTQHRQQSLRYARQNGQTAKTYRTRCPEKIFGTKSEKKRKCRENFS